MQSQTHLIICKHTHTHTLLCFFPLVFLVMLQVKGGGAVGVGGGRVRRQERHQRTPGDTATLPAYSSRPAEGGREGGRGGNSLHLLPAVWSRMWVVQIWVLLDMNEAKAMAQLIWKSEYRQKYSTAKNNKYSISFSSAAVYLFEEESASEVSCAAIYCKVMYKYSWVFRGVHFSFFVLTENSRLFQRFLRVISSKYETKIKGTKSVFVPKVKLHYNADDFLLLELIFSYCILLYMKYFFLLCPQ